MPSVDLCGVLTLAKNKNGVKGQFRSILPYLDRISHPIQDILHFLCRLTSNLNQNLPINDKNTMKHCSLGPFTVIPSRCFPGLLNAKHQATHLATRNQSLIETLDTVSERENDKLRQLQAQWDENKQLQERIKTLQTDLDKLRQELITERAKVSRQANGKHEAMDALRNIKKEVEEILPSE